MTLIGVTFLSRVLVTVFWIVYFLVFGELINFPFRNDPAPIRGLIMFPLPAVAVGVSWVRVRRAERLARRHADEVTARILQTTRSMA